MAILSSRLICASTICTRWSTGAFEPTHGQLAAGAAVASGELPGAAKPSPAKVAAIAITIAMRAGDWTAMSDLHAVGHAGPLRSPVGERDRRSRCRANAML